MRPIPPFQSHQNRNQSLQYPTYNPSQHAYSPWKAKSALTPPSNQRLIEAASATCQATAEESDERPQDQEDD